MATVTVQRRFCGPPDSGNGGYVAGLAAQALGDGPAEVTLRRPPPLDRPLRVEQTATGIALLDGDAAVAEARPTDRTFDVPPPVRLPDAAETASGFDVSRYTSAHPFPRCFACGPARDEGDGLRLFPAPTGRDDVLVAWPWRPSETLAAPDGLVDVPAVWAALDCPSGGAWWFDLDEPTPPAVLGRMAAVVHRRPAPDEPLVVGGWRGADDGRKLHAGSAVWDERGDLLAAGATTWIVLSEDQLASFGAAG
jgi:hypothetical protein